MAEAIIYCDKCGHIITPASKSDALIGEQLSVCKECARDLSPVERQAVVGKQSSGKRPSSSRRFRESTRRSLTPVGGTVATVTPRSKAIVVACGLAAGVLGGVAVALMVSSKGTPPEAATVSPASPQRQPDTATTAASAAPDAADDPTPPRTEDEPASPARRRLDEITSWRDPALARYGDMRSSLLSFATDFAGEAEAGEANKLLAEIDAQYAGHAETALAEASSHAADLAAKGEYAKAADVIREVPARFGEGEWLGSRGRRLVQEAVDGVEKIRVEEIRSVIARAASALEAGELAIARRALAQTATWPAAERARAGEIIQGVERREREIEKRRAGAEAWLAFSKELLKAGPAGVKRVGAALAKRKERLRGLGLEKRVARLESHIRAARRVETLARTGLNSKRGVIRIDRAGQPVTGRVVDVSDDAVVLKSTTGGQFQIPLKDLAIEDMAKFAGLFDSGDANMVRAARYYLVRGDLGAAREALHEMEGDQSARVLEDVEMLAEALPPSRRAKDAPPKQEARSPARPRTPKRITSAARKRPTPPKPRRPRPGANRMAWSRKGAFKTHLNAGDIDMNTVAQWVDGTTSGAPDGFWDCVWSNGRPSGHQGCQYGKSRSAGWRHLRIGFKKPVLVGTVVMLSYNASMVSVLRRGARHPGRIDQDSDWLPATRLHHRAEVSLWSFPPGTVATSLRVSYNAPQEDREMSGRISSLYMLPDCFVNVAPYATPWAASNPGAAAKILDGGHGTWDNAPGDGASIVSKQNPEQLVLSWGAPVMLRGLLAVRAGFSHVEVYAYIGPDDRNPVTATGAHWRHMGGYSALEQYPRAFGPSWFDFGRVVSTRAVRLVITEPEGKGFVHPHREGWTHDGKRAWLVELLALQPTDERPVAELVAELTGSKANVTLPPKTDGYYFTGDMQANLSRRYQATRVAPRTFAALGGAVAANDAFDAAIKSRLGDDHAFATRTGFAKAGLRHSTALQGLERRLAREKPEMVRICFDATDLAKGGTAVSLESKLEKIVNAVLGQGGVPVLFTIPMRKPADDKARGLVEDYNRMVVGLAIRSGIPAVDAYGLLNDDAGKAQEYFKARGRIKAKGYDAVNASFLKLYRTLVVDVMGRDVPALAEQEPELAAAQPAQEDTPQEQPAVKPDEKPVDVAEEAAPRPTETTDKTADSLIANGGFEKWDGRAKFAAQWRAHSWGESARRFSARIDRTFGHTGERSLTVRSYNEGCRPGAYTTVTLAAGTYVVTYWACADVEEEARVQCHVGGVDLDVQTVGDSWKQFTQSITIEKRVLGAGVKLWAMTPKVRVWFDDVSVVRADGE